MTCSLLASRTWRGTLPLPITANMALHVHLCLLRKKSKGRRSQDTDVRFTDIFASTALARSAKRSASAVIEVDSPPLCRGLLICSKTILRKDLF